MEMSANPWAAEFSIPSNFLPKLRGNPSLCIFGIPYSLGGLEPAGRSCLLISSVRVDFLRSSVVFCSVESVKRVSSETHCQQHWRSYLPTLQLLSRTSQPTHWEFGTSCEKLFPICSDIKISKSSTRRSNG